MRIDTIGLKQKPDKNENMIGVIVNSIARVQNANYSLEELATALETGHTICIDWFQGRNKSENFLRTNFVGIDVDDEDADFERTSELLEQHGYNFYIRYKSFSYKPEHQKHRYLLKFDEYLSQDEVMRVYQHLSTFLDIDGSTIANLCRLWFGTSFKIRDEDKPGRENSKLNVLNSVPELATETTTFKNVSREFDFTITDLDMDEFKRLCDESITAWEYHTIRSTVYSACMIIWLQTGEPECIEHFINSLPPDKRKRWINIQKHDTVSKKIYYSSGIHYLKQFATIHTSNVQDVFDILQDVDFVDLKHDDFITAKHVREMSHHTSLLVAPAGTGKTTAIIELSLEEQDVYRILTVPTIAICQQLEQKYSKYSNIEFSYSQNEERDTDKHVSLTICTYDAYVYRYINTNHILYIDEAHELLSFRSIGGKRDIIDYMLHNLPEIVVFVTATPFNLANVFTKKTFFRRPTNKNLYIKPYTTVIDGVAELLMKHEGKKTLVYINSKKKIENISRTLQHIYPTLRIGVVSSAERDSQCFTEILETGNTTYDVVIVTKFLNIGFDINHIFDLVIYGDYKIKANDMLQFFNRERQRAKFILLLKEVTEPRGVNVNSSYLYYKSRLSTMFSNYDKNVLDNKHVGGTLNPHVVTDNVFYNTVQLSIKHIVQLFEIFYPNIEPIVENIIDAPTVVDSVKINVFEEFVDYAVSEEVSENFTKMAYGSDMNIDNTLSSATIKRIYKVYAALVRNIDNVSEDFVTIAECGEKYEITCDPYKMFYLTDRYHCNKFESDVIKNLLNDIASQPSYTPATVKTYCDKLNVSGVLFDNSQWNIFNFRRRLEKLNIYTSVSRSSTKNEEGKRENIITNESIYLDDSGKEVLR
jgi:hypothetical protein